MISPLSFLSGLSLIGNAFNNSFFLVFDIESGKMILNCIIKLAPLIPSPLIIFKSPLFGLSK